MRSIREWLKTDNLNQQTFRDFCRNKNCLLLLKQTNITEVFMQMSVNLTVTIPHFKEQSQYHTSKYNTHAGNVYLLSTSVKVLLTMTQNEDNIHNH